MGGALVTGAGRGLGLEIARRLARRGLAVAVTDIDRDAARSAAASLGPTAWASELDVRDPAACERAAEEVEERAGSLDVWVNNAGVVVTGFAWEHQPETRRLLFDVNALGTINGTVAALARMRPAGRGHVVNIVSLAGLAAPPGETLYAATKHAAIAFSLGTLGDLRRSGLDRIHVSAVCPDGIWTPMLHDRLDDPHAAASFSGTLLSAERVASEAVSLLDRPRPLVAVPPWRGVLARLVATFPRAFVPVMPWMLADARRRQRRWKRRIAAGEEP